MSANEVVYDYDYKNDSLFIYCAGSYEYDFSLELDNNVILDIDTNAKPVAFEFLNASQVFNLDKAYFKKLANISIHTAISEESIALKVQLLVPVQSRNHVFDVSRVSSNLSNIPAIEENWLCGANEV